MSKPKSKPLKALPGEEEELEDDGIDTEQLNLAPDDPMRAFLPASFGKQKVVTNVQVQFDRTKRVPLDAPDTMSKGKGKAKQIQPKFQVRRVEESSDDGNGGNDDDDDDGDDNSDDDDDEEEYPISHELVIKDHTKPVSCISLDPSGTRMATASHDYLVKFYDFPSMSSDHLRAFKSLEPSESHHIHSATFSHVDSGQHVLIIPAAAQAKILTRDGDNVVEFIKGDMYLRDMHNTKGHVSEITAGAWHPTDKNVIVTAGTDSTMRIWDVNSKRQHRDIMVHKSKTGKGGRSRMCCLSWAGKGGEAAGNMIGTVALDGVLSIWVGNGPYTRPIMEVRNAHKQDTWTGGIAFSHDGRMLVTRGQDGDIKRNSSLPPLLHHLSLTLTCLQSGTRANSKSQSPHVLRSPPPPPPNPTSSSPPTRPTSSLVTPSVTSTSSRQRPSAPNTPSRCLPAHPSSS